MQPPDNQNPWSDPQPPPISPPPGNMPPDYAPSGSVAPSGYGPPGNPQIRFEIISEAWQLLQQQMGTWVVAALIYVVLTGAVTSTVGAVFGLVSPAPTPDPENPFALFGPAFVIQQLISSLASAVAGAFLLGGMFRMAINQIRGQAITIGDVFSAGDVFPALFIGTVLMQLIIGAGIVLCVIPGLIFSGLLLLTYPLIADKRLSATDAISQSWNALKPQMGAALLFAIVVGLVSGIGICLCCVGILFTFPLYILSIALLYRDFFIGPTSGFTAVAPAGPPPPFPEAGTGQQF